MKKKDTFPHFRRYKKSNHPALITSERTEKEYNYRKVMHSEKDGRHLNEKVYPNPDKRDKKPMYISKRVKHDKKVYFSKSKLQWKYPKGNKKKVAPTRVINSRIWYVSTVATLTRLYNI